MKERFIQSMAWLHTWGGLLPGWLLFVIFFAGSLSCFDKEITHWMRPSVHQPTPSQNFSYDRAFSLLPELAPETQNVWLRAPERRDRLPVFGWFREDGGYEYRYLRPDGGAVLEDDTRGGEFFFSLHYTLNFSWGYWLVGFAGMCMLVALVTGLVIHRRIFTDFFTFRREGTRRRAWLDAHNVSSVLALPFHLLITYTGLVIFGLTYIPAGIHAAYQGDEERFSREAEGGYSRPAAGRPGTGDFHSIDAFAAAAVKQWHEGTAPGWVNILHIGDANATVAVWRQQPASEIAWINDSVYFDAASGELLHVSTPPSAGHHVEHFLSGLHFAQFGGHSIRWLYLFMGLTGCLMIASGLVFWIEKRAQRHGLAGALSGFHLVRALNVAVIAGLMLAAAAYFWANRLLPESLPQRGGWEIGSFFTVWILALLHAGLRVRSPRLWREQLWSAAGAWLCIPPINAFTQQNSSLPASIAAGDWRLASVDLMTFAVGLLIALIARAAGRDKECAEPVNPEPVPET